MLDHAAPFLRRARQEAGHILEGDEGNVEGIAEANEARRLDRRIDVEHAGQHLWLIGDDPDHASTQAREGDDHVLRVVFLHLEEGIAVDHASDHIFDVVRLVRLGRHQRVEVFVHPVDRVVGRAIGRILEVVLRKIGEESLGRFDAVDIVARGEVGDAGARVVRHRAA